MGRSIGRKSKNRRKIITVLVWAKALWTTVGGKKFPPFLFEGGRGRVRMTRLSCRQCFAPAPSTLRFGRCMTKVHRTLCTLVTVSLGRGRVRISGTFVQVTRFRAHPAPRDFVTRSWLRSHDEANAWKQVSACCLHVHLTCTDFTDDLTSVKFCGILCPTS